MITCISLGLLFSLIVITLVYNCAFGYETYSLDSKPHNTTFSVWAAKWHQWLISSPQQENPAADSSGTFCAIRQSEPVWFLAGSLGDSVERTCEIPYGKDILIPVIVSSCDDGDFMQPVTPEFLTSCAKQDNNNVLKKEVLIDGTKIPDSEIHRVTTSQFAIQYPPDNIFGAAPTKAHTVVDGFWVFLKPLNRGPHTISFNAVTPPNPATGAMGFVVDVKYNIKID